MNFLFKKKLVLGSLYSMNNVQTYSKLLKNRFSDQFIKNSSATFLGQILNFKGLQCFTIQYMAIVVVVRIKRSSH